ncbi:MAG: ABC transporter permease [Planctomycetota bacterium]
MNRLIARLATLWFLVRRSLRQHAVSTAITAACVSLACGLSIAVFSVKAQTQAAFTGGNAGFDAVLGARGSALQLVLNAVYHLETSPGNIPWQLYQDVKRDPRVTLAIPYAVGDSYRGFRVVGTTAEVFTTLEYRAGEKLTVAHGGRCFDPARREAVIGSTVAARSGLRVGACFAPSHGIARDAEQHDEQYVVVGVLEPSNSPCDRVIFIPIDGVFRMSGHVLRGSGDAYTPRAGLAIDDAHKEVSAVLLKLNGTQAGFALDQAINRQGKVATLAWPIGTVMAELFDKLGWVNRVLELVAYLVVIVAAASILASLYNTMNERRREVAILRSLGARRRTVFGVIVLEASTIAAAGSMLGILVHFSIMAVVAAVLQRETGVVLHVLTFQPVMVIAPGAMVTLGALAGLVPAAKAYGTEVALHLAPTS